MNRWFQSSCTIKPLVSHLIHHILLHTIIVLSHSLCIYVFYPSLIHPSYFIIPIKYSVAQEKKEWNWSGQRNLDSALMGVDIREEKTLFWAGEINIPLNNCDSCCWESFWLIEEVGISTLYMCCRSPWKYLLQWMWKNVIHMRSGLDYKM